MPILVPSRILKTPWTLPAGFLIAQKTEELVSIVSSVTAVNLAYSLGTNPNISFYYKVRNNSHNAPLDVRCIYPSFLKCDMEFSVTVSPKQLAVFNFSINEENVESRILQRQYLYQEEIAFNVIPIGYSGNIYIDSTLPPLIP